MPSALPHRRCCSESTTSNTTAVHDELAVNVAGALSVLVISKSNVIGSFGLNTVAA